MEPPADTVRLDPPLRAVVLGAGRRGIAHARAAAACGATVVAVYDPDLQRAYLLAEEADAKIARSPEEALAAGSDVALISSPPAAHAEQTIAALRAGCHVILEKPIALTMEEALRIGRVAAETGRRVHVCQQHRYSRAMDYVREALAGRKVALAHIWLYRQAPDIRANWDRAWGGGHIVEWAIHPIDFCRAVLGDVETVYATYANQVLAGTEGWNNWDAYACALRFACGAVGAVATTYAAWPGLGGFGLDIVAEGLIVRWRGGRLEIERPGETEVYPEPGDPTLTLHQQFYRWIRTGDESGIRLDYADALRSLATVLACNRSNETGRPVRVADLLGEEAG